MYTLARSGLKQRVFAGHCSVMHQWHPVRSSSRPSTQLLQFDGGEHVTADYSSPFLWNGSRLDVDRHLGGAGADGHESGDDWGLPLHDLEQQIVEANAR
jgi:hypothetical protein